MPQVNYDSRFSNSGYYAAAWPHDYANAAYYGGFAPQDLELDHARRREIVSRWGG
jgi:hypothetical protein